MIAVYLDILKHDQLTGVTIQTGIASSGSSIWNFPSTPQSPESRKIPVAVDIFVGRD